jgi:hypothetical protein
MEAQHQHSGGGRRRRRRNRTQGRMNQEPILIVARRPDSPLLLKPKRKVIAASAAPKPELPETPKPVVTNGHALKDARDKLGPVQRREVRIVQPSAPPDDARERQRQRLYAELLNSKGRIAISRAADNLTANEIAMPKGQAYQLQLLEHLDESKAREAIGSIADCLQREAPHKKPVLDQRLRRLEEHGDDISTREAAATLRRALRL